LEQAPLNTSLDADIYIYEKLFANKNHTIDREIGQRKDDDTSDDDGVWSDEGELVWE
jgi:hypothetical protein